MKLLKFLKNDAPHSIADARLSNQRLSFPSTKRVHGESRDAKAWTVEKAPSTMQGGYWLLDDQGQPICVVTDILFAVPENASTTAGRGTSVVATAQGISDTEVDGLDFRSKVGRQMEREHATYGSTYKTASNSARLMMNAEMPISLSIYIYIYIYYAYTYAYTYMSVYMLLYLYVSCKSRFQRPQTTRGILLHLLRRLPSHGV